MQAAAAQHTLQPSQLSPGAAQADLPVDLLYVPQRQGAACSSSGSSRDGLIRDAALPAGFPQAGLAVVLRLPAAPTARRACMEADAVDAVEAAVVAQHRHVAALCSIAGRTWPGGGRLMVVRRAVRRRHTPSAGGGSRTGRLRPPHRAHRCCDNPSICRSGRGGKQRLLGRGPRHTGSAGGCCCCSSPLLLLLLTSTCACRRSDDGDSSKRPTLCQAASILPVRPPRSGLWQRDVGSR